MTKPADFETVWDTLAMDSTRKLELDETIGGRAESWTETLRAQLPRFPMSEDAEGATMFRLRHVLGEGGMGVVHLATQNALGRDVAIKTVKQTSASDDAVHALLQEARIMGMVEHPNVVPVHVIGADEEDRPIIVMKRVEGQNWLDAMDEEVEDPIGHHVAILVEVCQALSFAHNRGILHRDIKPANVMIGAFGEVYLLDWGLAVTTRDDLPFVPKAKLAQGVVGTPMYMAPEMTTGDGELLGVHTDVFLLGAVLYEILTGRPPNRGDRLFEVMRFSYEGHSRSYPDDVPDEIRAIAERAMALRPEDRYGSVEEMRLALVDFLEHRNSRELVTQSLEHVEALEEALADVDDADAVDAYQLFGAARFGLEQALTIWEGNTEARAGLQRCLETMIRHEISRENLQAASVLAVDLPEPNPEIDALLEGLRARVDERDAELASLRRLRRDVDPDVGIHYKSWYAIAMGFGFLMLGLVPTVVRATLGHGVTHPIFVATGVSFAPVLVAVTVAGRRTYLANAANRALLVCFWLSFALATAIRITAWRYHTDISVAVAAEQFLFVGTTGMVGIFLDRRFLAGTSFFFLGGLATAIVPAFPLEIYAVAAFFACVATGVLGFVGLRNA